MEQIIAFVVLEVYRNIVTWPTWSAARTRSMQQLTTSLHHLAFKRTLLKGFWEFGDCCCFFFNRVNHPSSAINFCLLQTLMFWSHLASLCPGHRDLRWVIVILQGSEYPYNISKHFPMRLWAQNSAFVFKVLWSTFGFQLLWFMCCKQMASNILFLNLWNGDNRNQGWYQADKLYTKIPYLVVTSQ